MWLLRAANTRGVGVLTKPDRIPLGEEASWINKIQSSGKDGGIEYFSVKNPDSQDIRSGITYGQAREKEAEFFSTRAPWSNLEWLYQRRLGTEKLTRRLGQVLSDLISRRHVFAVLNFGVDSKSLAGFPSCRRKLTGCSSKRTTTFPDSQARRRPSQWRRF
jgi:Dynamin central region